MKILEWVRLDAYYPFLTFSWTLVSQIKKRTGSDSKGFSTCLTLAKLATRLFLYEVSPARNNGLRAKRKLEAERGGDFQANAHLDILLK